MIIATNFDFLGFLIFNKMETTNEIWKDVPGYENLYQVSNLGKIKSISTHYKINGGILKLKKDKDGYEDVSLYKNNKPKTMRVHRIVLLAFIGKDNRQVHHINEIKHDNKLENLTYLSGRENVSDYRKRRIHSSLFIGVHWGESMSKWVAGIRFNKRSIHLGYFNCEKMASEAYNNALQEIENSTFIKTKRNPSSIYKGVGWHKWQRKWAARIRINNSNKNLGYFKTELEAHEAYQKALTEKLALLQTPLVNY